MLCYSVLLAAHVRAGIGSYHLFVAYHHVLNILSPSTRKTKTKKETVLLRVFCHTHESFSVRTLITTKTVRNPDPILLQRLSRRPLLHRHVTTRWLQKSAAMYSQQKLEPQNDSAHDAAHGVLFCKPGLQAQRLHHPVWHKNELLGGTGVQYATRDA